MLAWVDDMTAQIEDAALTDPNKPYSNDAYHDAVQDLRDYIESRHAAPVTTGTKSPPRPPGGCESVGRSGGGGGLDGRAAGVSS